MPRTSPLRMHLDHQPLWALVAGVGLLLAAAGGTSALGLAPGPLPEVVAPADALTALHVSAALPHELSLTALGPDLSVRYRCANTFGSGTLLTPAKVGNCLFEPLVTSVSGALRATLLVTPLAPGTYLAGIGVREYNLGLEIQASTGSPVQIETELTPFSLTSSSSLCDATAKATYRTTTGSSRIASIRASKGLGMFSTSDHVNVDAPFTSPTPGPKTASFALSGVCSGTKQIKATLPTGLAAVDGKFASYTFGFTGIPTSLTFRMADTSASTTEFTIDHNSNSLSGWANLGSFGWASVANAPQHIVVRILRYTSSDSGFCSGAIAAGELKAFEVIGSSVPSAGADLFYSGTIKGMSLYVNVKKLTGLSLEVDLDAKRYGGNLEFVAGQGFLDVDIKGLKCKKAKFGVELYGTKLSSAFVQAQASSPYIQVYSTQDVGGRLTGEVDFSFWGLSLDKDIGLRRDTSGVFGCGSDYKAVRPFAPDACLAPGWCLLSALGNWCAVNKAGP